MTPLAVTCPKCKGEGYIAGLLCDECNGTCRVVIPEYQPDRRVIRALSWGALILVGICGFLWGWLGK